MDQRDTQTPPRMAEMRDWFAYTQRPRGQQVRTGVSVWLSFSLLTPFSTQCDAIRAYVLYLFHQYVAAVVVGTVDRGWL